MLGTLAGSQPAPPKLASVRCIQYQSRHYSCHVTRKSLVYTHTCDQGCPQANRGDHFNPTSASTNPRQNPHSRVLRFPRTSPAGSFFGGFRTPAPAQAAPSPWAGIRNPAQSRHFGPVRRMSACPLTAVREQTFRDRSFGPKHKVAAIGIGGSLAAPPLPHHRAYGSVHGGSRSCANTLGTRVGWAFGFMHRRERFDVFPSRLPGFTRRRR